MDVRMCELGFSGQHLNFPTFQLSNVQEVLSGAYKYVKGVVKLIYSPSELVFIDSVS